MTDVRSGFLDRDLRLSEVLSAENLKRLQKDLGSLFGSPVVIVDPGIPATPGWKRAPVPWELEPIGYIEVEQATVEQLASGVDLLVLMIKATIQYQLAAEFHLETTLADYHTLENKHKQLQASEARYRELSSHLEEKVAAQVEEINAAQLKIYQAEKLASVGRLAAGVAHELNTPLGFILNNLECGKGYLTDILSFLQEFQQGGSRDNLQRIWQESDIDYLLGDFGSLLADSLEGVQRAAAIVGDLKIFANINRQEYAEVNINEQLKNVIKILESQIKDRQITIAFNAGELPETYCYPAMLAQVFYNIIENGVQAIEGDGQVDIITTLENDMIKVAITDSGSGISKENLTRIFEPFFSTKEIGSGTGLGLSVAYDILRAHRGWIEVESILGVGSTFIVVVPLTTVPFPEDSEAIATEPRL